MKPEDEDIDHIDTNLHVYKELDGCRSPTVDTLPSEFFLCSKYNDIEPKEDDGSDGADGHFVRASLEKFLYNYLGLGWSTSIRLFYSFLWSTRFVALQSQLYLMG